MQYRRERNRRGLLRGMTPEMEEQRSEYKKLIGEARESSGKEEPNGQKLE